VPVEAHVVAGVPFDVQVFVEDGPARLFSPEAVPRVTTALDALEVETLRIRFDPEAMAAVDVYPNIWTGPEEFDHLALHLAELHRFYRTAADNGQAVLLVIT
jgi:hypothetical protein